MQIFYNIKDIECVYINRYDATCMKIYEIFNTLIDIQNNLILIYILLTPMEITREILYVNSEK